jgi:hypothetical protein
MFPFATFVEQKAYMLSPSTEERMKEYASILELEQIELKTLSRKDGDAIDERSLAVGRCRVSDKST